MNQLFRALGLLLVSVVMFQCQKDLSYIGGPDTGVPVATTPDPVKADLQGNIVDENDQPAAGVTITVGTMTSVTNATGYFRIDDAPLDKNTSLVVAEKPGYFKSYRVFSATSGTNQVVIKLLKKALAGTITASSGGTATLSNGAKITLPASGVESASGNTYSGEVKVYATYIDPGASDITQTVPGSFAANDKNGKRVILSSFGMLAVELESPGGQKLQIKAGAMATLTSPIPAASLASAPANIALWYVDDQTGIWKEEGTATKQGNNYVGDVKHFSYWNCDYPYDAVGITMTVKDANGMPLANVPVNITTSGVNGAAHGYTDSLGQVKGLVPANRNLLLEVLDPCGNSIYSKNLAPISESTDLGIITISNSGPSVVTFTGTLLNCSGSPVSNGYAIITIQNFVRYASTNAAGKYAVTFTTCPGNSVAATVIGVDQTLQQQSGANSINVTTPLTAAGSLTACGTSSEQYINYTLDGVDYQITSTANDSIIGITNDSTNTYINGNKKAPGTDYITILVNNATAPGTYTGAGLFLNGYTSTTFTTPFNVTFTSFPNSLGQFYEGTFSGQFTADSATTVHTISSTFKVRRNN